jgi:hypothetical protein
MSFKLSGPPTKDDIKVAYIDPKLGLVEGVSIRQANKYALKEPGTTFIFRDGNLTLQYLNINEVNEIDPIILATTDECGGLSEKVEIGSPTIQIFGGGGIGAAGNPIVGNDGAILAVDVVRGGHGYKFPPLVAARGVGNNGSGATFVSVIGEVVETTETFENEADFEEYEIDEPTDVGYGQNWGPNGEDLGPWDPKTYTEPGENQFRQEVGKFEELVRRLAGGSGGTGAGGSGGGTGARRSGSNGVGCRNAFWTTRTARPTKVTCSDTKVIPSEYNVTFPAWNQFMNCYAISPVSPSNVRGSDFAGRLFTYEWTEDFPYDGEYIFRGLCDNQAQLYFDNLKVTDLAGFADAVIPIQKTITKGLHNIRVDLLNVPITETVTRPPTPPSESTIDVNFNIQGSSNAAQTHRFLINELGIDIFKPRKTGLNENITRTPVFGQVYEFEFITTGPTGDLRGENGFILITNNGRRIEIEDGPGGGFPDATVDVSQGRFFNVRGFKCSFVVGELTLAPTPPPSPNSPIQVKKVFNTLDYISKANRTLWRTNLTPSSRNSLLHLYGIAPFDTLAQESQTESYAGTHVITWDNINFPVDGSYRIRMAVDDIVTLFIGDEQIKYNGFIADTNALKNPDYNQNIFFKAGNYTIRAELEQSNVGPLAKGNPMALAIDIEVTSVTETIISAKSWNENPMGLALTIDAPEPPIPQEPILEQEGRCPNNPIWTTRFPSIAGYGYNDIPGTDQDAPQQFGADNDYPAAKSQGFSDADIRNYLETVYKFIPGKKIGPKMQDLLNDPAWGQPTPGVPLKIIYNLESDVSTTISSLSRSSNSSGWFPVRHRAWADFFNRYAISPIRPLNTPGTDGGGILFRNYWDIDIPYDGFYQFAVQKDNIARFYVDGTLAFDVKSSGDELWKDKRNKPKFQKVFITKGRHVISVELENEATEAYDQVNQKIFRTLDWQVSLPASSPQSTIIDVNFNFIGNSSAGYTHNYKITELGIDIFKPRKTGLNQNITKNCVSGQVYEVEFFRNGSPGGTIIQRNDSFIEYEDLGKPPLDASINIDKGKFLNVRGNKCSFVVGEPIPPAPITGGLTGGTSRDGVTYEGPALTSYIPGYISPVFQNVLTPTDEIQGKTWIMTWKNVDFPEDGQYDLITKADDLVIIRVDGIEVGRHNLGVDGENFKQSSFNATKGKRTLELELSNLSFPNTGFPENPVYTSVEINKNVSLLRTGSGKSWDENPIGVGAILIPPPCPRKISGKGVVTDIIPTSPGNGYLPPVSPLPPPPSTVSVTPSDVPGAAAGAPGAGVGAPGAAAGAPGAGVGAPGAGVLVLLALALVALVLAPGAGVGAPGAAGAPGAGVGAPPPPGVSPTIITIVPPSGAPTGINARFIPQFEVVRDPIVVNPQQLLQVTDLVGLKQTGYVNGRPYYGSVYYDRGIRYAGFYETVGEPVRVYDTLRESIIAQVTTLPSAILRQGTDIRSNDPLLNIPGTVQSTLSSNSIVGAGDISTPSVPFTQEPVQDPIYPVSLRLKRVLVQDRGINYNVTDKIRVIPSNGAILEPIFGSFGRVVKVAVIDPGFGFTEYPRIEMYTPL